MSHPFAQHLSELNAKATVIPLAELQVLVVTPQLLRTRGRQQSLLEVEPLPVGISLCLDKGRLQLRRRLWQQKAIATGLTRPLKDHCWQMTINGRIGLQTF